MRTGRILGAIATASVAVALTGCGDAQDSSVSELVEISGSSLFQGISVGATADSPELIPSDFTPKGYVGWEADGEGSTALIYVDKPGASEGRAPQRGARIVKVQLEWTSDPGTGLDGLWAGEFERLQSLMGVAPTCVRVDSPSLAGTYAVWRLEEAPAAVTLERVSVFEDQAVRLTLGEHRLPTEDQFPRTEVSCASTLLLDQVVDPN